MIPPHFHINLIIANNFIFFHFGFKFVISNHYWYQRITIQTNFLVFYTGYLDYYFHFIDLVFIFLKSIFIIKAITIIVHINL